MSERWTYCPQCGQPMSVERVHNGIVFVWHGTHCGYGQAYVADADTFAEEPHAADEICHE